MDIYTRTYNPHTHTLYTYRHVNTCTHTHLHIHNTDIYIYPHLPTHICTHMYKTRAHSCTHTYKQYTYTWTPHTQAYTYTHINTCTWMHTYTHNTFTIHRYTLALLSYNHNPPFVALASFLAILFANCPGTFWFLFMITTSGLSRPRAGWGACRVLWTVL